MSYSTKELAILDKASKMRTSLIIERNGEMEILLADLSGTSEGKDRAKVIDLMPGPRGSFIASTKIDIKPIDRIAFEKYRNEPGYENVEFFDITKESEEKIKNFINHSTFDFPGWLPKKGKFDYKKIGNYNVPVLIQAAACNMRCGYCFVDDKSNDSKNLSGKIYVTCEEAVDSMFNAKRIIDEQYKKVEGESDREVFRLTGGDFSVSSLDYAADICDETHSRNKDILIRLDSNLSFGIVYDEFVKRGIYDDNVLKRLAKHDVKVLAAVKGTDQNTLIKNVRAPATMKNQFYSMEKLVGAGIDTYISVYEGNSKTFEKLLYDMDDRIENASRRTILGEIKLEPYGPTKERLTKMAIRKGKKPEYYIAEYQKRLNSEHEKNVSIIDNYLKKEHGVAYREVCRSDVKLKLL